jgi:Family of unknown function (DUF6526)
MVASWMIPSAAVSLPRHRAKSGAGETVSMAKTQSYENHTRWLPFFHFFALPVLMINVLNTIRHLYLAPSSGTAFAVLVAAALLAVAFLARTQPLTAQDRLIRLEMRLRLQRLLPAELMARFDELSVKQLIAMRFACDAEMAELVTTVLKDNPDQKTIKKMIKQWVPDHLRV